MLAYVAYITYVTLNVTYSLAWANEYFHSKCPSRDQETNQGQCFMGSMCGAIHF